MKLSRWYLFCGLTMFIVGEISEMEKENAKKPEGQE
jgi:hypothetical protein